MRGPDYLPGRPTTTLSLDLLDGNSGRWLKSWEAGDHGEFDFGNAAPGLYFLNLKPPGLWGWSGEPITGSIAVTVDPAALAEHLEIDLGWSSCGLWYADQSQCPHKDLRIEHFAGQVLDTSGSLIPNARILLFDSAGKIVGQLQSDRAGKFSSRRSLTGTYQLVVSGAGFTPLRVLLQLEPPTNPKGFTPLTVHLGVSGNCSSAEE